MPSLPFAPSPIRFTPACRTRPVWAAPLSDSREVPGLRGRDAISRRVDTGRDGLATALGRSSAGCALAKNLPRARDLGHTFALGKQRADAQQEVVRGPELKFVRVSDHREKDLPERRRVVLHRLDAIESRLLK